MKSTGAFLEGLRRVSRAPGLVMAIWAVNLAVAAPLAIFLLESIHSFTARSGYNETLMEGMDTGWYVEFSSSGGPLEESFTPSHVGIGAWLANLDRWWDGSVFLEHPLLVATGGLFALLWLLVLGGILEAMREGAPRPRLATVLSDGFGFFPRLSRLAVLTGAGYYLIFRLVRWLFPAVHRLTADFTAESRVLLYNLAAAALVVLLIALVRIVSDYAKIAMVHERHAGVLRALGQALRLVGGNFFRVLGIACYYGVAMTLLFSIYSVFAPGPGDSTALAILLSFALSQVFLIAKQTLRVAVLASETAFYEVNG